MKSMWKGTLAAVAAGVVLSGCATTGSVAELESRISTLEGSLSRIESTANEAMTASRRSEDAEARRLAQRALTEAQEANERIRRMADTCCGPK